MERNATVLELLHILFPGSSRALVFIYCRSTNII